KELVRTERGPSSLGMFGGHVIRKGTCAAVAGELQHPRPQRGEEAILGPQWRGGRVEGVEVGHRRLQRFLESPRSEGVHQRFVTHAKPEERLPAVTGDE